MPRHWSVYYQAKHQAFITAFGRRYDSVPEISYVVYSGPCMAIELYCVQGNSEAASYDRIASTDPEAKKLDGTQATFAREARLPAADWLLDLRALPRQ
jgi:hypothetical protein